MGFGLILCSCVTFVCIPGACIYACVLKQHKKRRGGGGGAGGNSGMYQQQVQQAVAGGAMPMQVPNVMPGSMVSVPVPAGAGPGSQICVDPDGPEGPLPPMMITVPAGLTAGMMMQVQVPMPPAAPPVAIATVVAVPQVAPAVATAVAPTDTATTDNPVAAAPPVAVATAVPVTSD
eukprot:SAG22_NODE_3290_length_1803_cov_1.421948_2_plen_176_part_00